MPMLAFKCTNEDCGKEFERLLYNTASTLQMWCKHCDKITIWDKVIHRNHGMYHDYGDVTNLRELVCCSCGGSKCMKPFMAIKISDPDILVTACPICSSASEHILKVDVNGKDDVAHSSIRFNFNYLAPDV